MISMNWVKDYIDLKGENLEELADKVTKAGVNVEHVISNNIKNIQLFKVYFKIENKRREKEKEKERLFKLFNDNNAVQLNKDKENFIIFHKCTKNNNNKFQISFFDRLGPFSDIAAATIEELIDKFYNYGSFQYSNIFEIIE